MLQTFAKSSLPHVRLLCVHRWTIPEVRECLLEAGFRAVHVWMREMPDLEGRDEDEEVEVDANSKYVECNKFLQCDAWNAYVVAIN